MRFVVVVVELGLALSTREHSKRFLFDGLELLLLLFSFAFVDGQERVEYGKVGLEFGGFASAEQRYESA